MVLFMAGFSAQKESKQETQSQPVMSEAMT